jgi:hypothetical protein
MSRAEIWGPVRQHLTARIDAWRYQQGVIRPMDSRVYWGRKLDISSSPQLTCVGSAVLLQQRFPVQAQEMIARAEQICKHHFDLLGYHRVTTKQVLIGN